MKGSAPSQEQTNWYSTTAKNYREIYLGSAESINKVFTSNDILTWTGTASRKAIENFTIENMAIAYYQFLSDPLTK